LTVHTPASPETNETYEEQNSVKVAKDRNEAGTENARLIDNENPRREECNFLGFPSSIIYKAYE